MKRPGLLPLLLMLALAIAGTRLARADGPLTLQQVKTAHGIFYYVKISPDSGYDVKPGVSDTLMPIEKFNLLVSADETNMKPLPALINAGFFDPANQQTTSYGTLDGKQVLDPKQNKRLTDNPALAPYLTQIFNRTEFRVYRCGTQAEYKTKYGIASHNAAAPQGCSVFHALGAGPALLPKRTDRAEGFIDYDADKKIIRDPVGVNRRDARSAVGLTCDGTVILAMGSQVPETPAGTGFTLGEMAEQLKKLGATRAMALDGGSSSGIMVEGVATYGKYGKDGVVKRPVKSFLMALPSTEKQVAK